MDYTYKNNTYSIMFESQMKIGQAWIDCIVYQSHRDDKIYVRERGDFFEKFKPK